MHRYALDRDIEDLTGGDLGFRREMHAAETGELHEPARGGLDLRR